MPHPMTLQIIEALQQASDLEKAEGMQAYMKTTQPFYGVATDPRRKSFKKIVQNFKKLTHTEYEQIIFELWHGKTREEMYQALEVAQHYRAYHNLESWHIYDQLVKSATNWDTLDWIVGRVVSPLVLRHRELEVKLIEWSKSDNFWVRRASLLAHLKHKEKTNTTLLADTILRLAHEQEFFIRKAIGWILRQYSSVNPDWVAAFVDERQDKLSGLSQREALKRINKLRQENKKK